MAWTTLGTVAPGDVLRANSGTAAYNNVIGNLTVLRGDYMQAKRTAGDLTLNSNLAWANVQTGLDLTLAASAGDVIEYSINGLAISAAVELYFDVVTVVSGNPVNSFARDTTPANPSTSFGLIGWLCPASVISPISGSVFRTLVSGDISGDNVLLRLRYASSAATNRVINATSASPMHVWARNHGPVEV